MPMDDGLRGFSIQYILAAAATDCAWWKLYPRSLWLATRPQQQQQPEMKGQPAMTRPRSEAPSAPSQTLTNTRSLSGWNDFSDVECAPAQPPGAGNTHQSVDFERLFRSLWALGVGWCQGVCGWCYVSSPYS